MLFVQLALGASMWHSHTGLSIPIFQPLTESFSAARRRVDRAHQRNTATEAAPPITPGLIMLQYIHRGWAVLIVIGLVTVATAILRNRHIPAPVRSAAGFWILLVIAQFLLGAWTIWSNKAADIATSHVFVGALTFVTGVLLSVVFSGMLSSTRREVSLTLRKEVARA
jgi:cytochrome c oxidase assembly protein subunit 15